MSAASRAAAWLLSAAALLSTWSICLTFSFGIGQRPLLHGLTWLCAVAIAALLALPRRPDPTRLAVQAGFSMLLVGGVEFWVLLLRGVDRGTALGLVALALPLSTFVWGLVYAVASERNRGSRPARLHRAERRRFPAAYGALLLCAGLPLGAVEMILFQTEKSAKESGAVKAAEAMAQVARLHDVKTGQALLGRTPLPSGARVLLRLPSGSLVPEDAAAEIAEWPFVERPDRKSVV